MKFLDQVKIMIKAGDGGNGCVAFRSEKFIEFGGVFFIIGWAVACTGMQYD